MTENNTKTSETESVNSCNKDHSKCCKLSRFSKVLICALLGSLVTIFVQNYYHRQQEFVYYSNPNFNGRDVFEEMQVIERRLDNMMEANRQHMMNQDRSQMIHNNVFQSNIISKQDNDYYCYELSFSGFKKKDINIKVKDGILTLSSESKEHDGSMSNFYYSFSLPEYDLKKEPQIIRNDGQIIVKFSKRK